ncbi:MAG: dihydrodipicolinate synthase family protein [Chloroflexi bacterium]|nr:dihydrodipicolinate synthase family protein [Chloroflexota bacterium]
MKDIHLKGVVPAVILPMSADYEPDYQAFAQYLEWIIAENAVAVAVNMDTGEGPQLKAAERRKAVETAVRVANGRVAVVAGVMGGSTLDAVETARAYQEAGADGLVVFPNAAFRNDPLDPQVAYSYHKAIADATGLPIILFQLAPVFGGVNFSREALLKMLEIPEVVAIKEASFDAQYFSFTKQTVEQSGREITLLTGNDRFILESFLLGAEGALLGFCAVGCGLVAEILANLQRGRVAEAVAMRSRVQGFSDFIYQDPVLDYRVRCKAALAQLGVIDRSLIYVRPPMLQVSDEMYDQIGKALQQAGMIPVAAARS